MAPYSELEQIRKKIDTEYSSSRISAISDKEMTTWIEEAFGDEMLISP